ncbi:hypothetical protein BS78_02G229500 [Paspalum vaginatum]|nr:hypothetical protein BS78_02G229500 [Paspalum vaginatum]
MHNCPCLRRALRRRNLRLRRVPMSSPGPSMATSTCKKNERMQLKFKVPDEVTWKKEAAACDKHSGKDESITIRNGYPKPPVPYFEVTRDSICKTFWSLCQKGLFQSPSP